MRERIGKMIPGLAELAIVEERVRRPANSVSVDALKPRRPEPVDPRVALIPSRERPPYFVR